MHIWILKVSIPSKSVLSEKWHFCSALLGNVNVLNPTYILGSASTCLSFTYIKASSFAFLHVIFRCQTKMSSPNGYFLLINMWILALKITYSNQLSHKFDQIHSTDIITTCFIIQRAMRKIILFASELNF